MTTFALTCTIPGTPQQQGSKTRGAYGAMYEANRRLKPWRAHAITLHIARFWSKVEVGRPGRECARRWQRDYRARIAATRGLKQVLGGES